MKITLYILGTSHPLQCGIASLAEDKIVRFENELRNICDNFGIRRIAEEMTEDGLKEHGVNETIPEKVAKSIPIPYHNVDLNREERSHIGFGDSSVTSASTNIGFADGGGAFRKAFDELKNDVRERCWVAKILAKKGWPTLFVCGADHIQSVHNLWSSLDLGTVIVHEDYDP